MGKSVQVISDLNDLVRNPRAQTLHMQPETLTLCFLSSRRLNYHVEIGNPEEIQKYEEAFAEEIKTRGPDFKYFQDQGRAQYMY